MQPALLAVVRPGDTPHGYNLTFAFPMLMFIIIAGALYSAVPRRAQRTWARGLHVEPVGTRRR